jgi:hypothetical protein
MATKQEFLDFLNEALKTEESYLPLYTRHISSTLFLSGFEQEQKDRIRRILMTLHKESTEHAETFKRRIQTVEAGDKNVY